MRHVVHCSGYSLAERSVSGVVTNHEGKVVHGKFFDWNIVCLGNPIRNILGRITMSVRLANRLRAECLIWSTGATYLSGRSEAEIMMETAFDYLAAEQQPSDWLKSISVLEQESINTMTSMQLASQIVRDRFAIDEVMVHLVTSQNHAPRVARDGAIAFSAQPNAILSIVPANTPYGGKGPSQVSVQELLSDYT
jgi:hypothetical protein